MTQINHDSGITHLAQMSWRTSWWQVKEERSWLKPNIQNEDHVIQSHHFMANRWGNNGNSEKLYFLGLQNHCRYSRNYSALLLKYLSQKSNLKRVSPFASVISHLAVEFFFFFPCSLLKYSFFSYYIFHYNDFWFSAWSQTRNNYWQISSPLNLKVFCLLLSHVVVDYVNHRIYFTHFFWYLF